MAEAQCGTTLIDTQLIFDNARVEEGQNVAEFGCGHTGHYVFPLARRIGKNGSLYAIDIQKHVLKTIEERARVESITNIQTVWSDVERIGAANIPNASLHHIFLINTLFQTADRVAVLSEAYRLLSHGGRLTIVEWLPSGVPFGPPITARVRPYALEQLANEIGFKIYSRFSAGPYHYSLIFEK